MGSRVRVPPRSPSNQSLNRTRLEGDMINRSTVLVLGAGASHELGFPLGPDLLKQIYEATDFELDVFRELRKGDEVLYNYLKASAPDGLGNYLAASRRLRAVIPAHRSIDEALHFLSGDPFAVSIGKLAIARLITQAERKQTDPDQTWMPEFLSLVLAGHSELSVVNAFSNLSVISFNYDRSLEQFLYRALQSSALMTPEDAAALIKRLNIIRPYGRLGSLPWEKTDRIFSYGGLGNRENDYSVIAKNIRTFTEQENLTELKAQLRDVLYEAKTIIFLGFGFLGQNMKLLQVLTTDNRFMPAKTILGTVYKVFEENIANLEEALEGAFKTTNNNKATLLNLTAVDLLKKMSPTISSLVR
jgi:hypothetical protein